MLETWAGPFGRPTRSNLDVRTYGTLTGRADPGSARQAVVRQRDSSERRGPITAGLSVGSAAGTDRTVRSNRPTPLLQCGRVALGMPAESAAGVESAGRRLLRAEGVPSAVPANFYGAIVGVIGLDGPITGAAVNDDTTQRVVPIGTDRRGGWGGSVGVGGRRRGNRRLLTRRRCRFRSGTCRASSGSQEQQGNQLSHRTPSSKMERGRPAPSSIDRRPAPLAMAHQSRSGRPSESSRLGSPSRAAISASRMNSAR